MDFILLDKLKSKRLGVEDILRETECNISVSAVFSYMSGFEGLGTPNSDIDVYVLADEIPFSEIDNVQERTRAVVINDTKLDIEFWTFESLYMLIDGMMNDVSYLYSIDDIKILSKLKNSELLYDNEENEGERLIEAIMSVPIQKLAVDKYLRMARGDYDDALDFYYTKDYISGLNCARWCLEYAIGALNAHYDHVNLNPKWISKIFIMNGGYCDAYLQDYLRFQVYSIGENEEISLFLKDMLGFIQDLLTYITIDDIFEE